jgi:hypothetical protein
MSSSLAIVITLVFISSFAAIIYYTSVFPLILAPARSGDGPYIGNCRRSIEFIRVGHGRPQTSKKQDFAQKRLHSAEQMV